jgi:hypothetical protein
MKLFYAILTHAVFALAAWGAPPEVIIVSDSDDPIEQYAASELSSLLKTLFEAEVKVATVVPEAGGNVILLGSTAFNQGIINKQAASISDQGLILKSTKSGLIIRGGSPVATLWAVYEFGHSFGMRYLPEGDYAPIDPPAFSLSGFDTALMEPAAKVRAWRAIDSGTAGQESWGLADYEKLLRQLAKLRFNQVDLVIHEGQPFRDFEKGGDGELWDGRKFPVSGETAGRTVFDGAAVFENPDFAGKSTAEERSEAGLALMRGIRAAAKKLGMAVTIERDRDDPKSKLPILSLGQSKGGLLPKASSSALPGLLAKAAGGDGYAVECWIPGELGPDLYFLSRASYQPDLSPEESLDSLVTPICGEGVADRLANGFAAIEASAALIEKEDPDFAVPAPDMVMKHYASGEAVPEWWAKAKEQYGTAVNEMYRGNTRARGGARPFILYHAKRYTFALHYLTAVEHARLAGIARKAKDGESWVENLELSVEAMHNALSIYADVARDNSDRGVIAVLNEYGYRPLLKELDEVPLP